MPGAVVHCFQERAIPSQTSTWEEGGKLASHMWVFITQDRDEPQAGKGGLYSTKNYQTKPWKRSNQVISGKMGKYCHGLLEDVQGQAGFETGSGSTGMDISGVSETKKNGSPSSSTSEEAVHGCDVQDKFCSFILMEARVVSISTLQKWVVAIFSHCTSVLFFCLSCPTGWGSIWGWFWDNWKQ